MSKQLYALYGKHYASLNEDTSNVDFTDGCEKEPSINFKSNPSTGFYLEEGKICATINGKKMMSIGDNIVDINNPLVLYDSKEIEITDKNT